MFRLGFYVLLVSSTSLCGSVCLSVWLAGDRKDRPTSPRGRVGVCRSVRLSMGSPRAMPAMFFFSLLCFKAPCTNFFKGQQIQNHHHFSALLFSFFFLGGGAFSQPTKSEAFSAPWTLTSSDRLQTAKEDQIGGSTTLKRRVKSGKRSTNKNVEIPISPHYV